MAKIARTSKLVALALFIIGCALGRYLFVRHAERAEEARAAAITSETECVANRGVWTQGEGIPRPGARRYCVLPAADAGKQCSSSSDCVTGFCEAKDGYNAVRGQVTMGACAAFRHGGCMLTVEAGVIQDPMCIE